jgi:hypothetical protein
MQPADPTEGLGGAKLRYSSSAFRQSGGGFDSCFRTKLPGRVRELHLYQKVDAGSLCTVVMLLKLFRKVYCAVVIAYSVRGEHQEAPACRTVEVSAGSGRLLVVVVRKEVRRHKTGDTSLHENDCEVGTR